MFDWFGDATNWIGDQIGGAVEDVGSSVSEAVWDVMLKWLYETIYGAISEFFTMINGIGSGVFDLGWVNTFLTLFSYFGWALFTAGLIVAVFDVVIEYQTGRANIQSIREFPPSTEEQAILAHLADKNNVALRIYNRFVDSMEQRQIIQHAIPAAIVRIKPSLQISINPLMPALNCGARKYLSNECVRIMRDCEIPTKSMMDIHKYYISRLFDSLYNMGY